MNVRRTVRGRVPALTALLSAVSLALVFGAALGAIPTALLPRAPETVLDAIPHVNAAICAVAFVVVAVGWRRIRHGDVAGHRAAMTAGVVLFMTFLALYLYRVALLGPTEFGGPAAVRTAYLTVLAIHVLLAIVCVPLLYYVLLLAVSRSVPEIRRTNHRRIGRIAATLWLVSFGLGVVVYALLYLVY